MKQLETRAGNSAVTASASPAVSRRKTAAETRAAAKARAGSETAAKAVRKPTPKAVVEAKTVTEVRKFLHYEDRGTEAKEPRRARPIWREIRIERVCCVAVI